MPTLPARPTTPSTARPSRKRCAEALLLLCAATLALAPRAASADEYDTLRTKWQTRLTGGTAIDTADPDIAQAVAMIAANAQVHWNAMDKGAGRTYLWSDLASATTSSHVTNSYGRLHAMALAWSTKGSSLQGNAALAADIVAGLDWLYARRYNENVTYYDNWWDWHIGTPHSLTNTMTLMYDRLSATQRAAWLQAIDKFVPNPAVRLKPDGTALTTETGANLLDKALAVIVRGVLGKSSAKIIQGRDAISPGLLYVTQGDGFYVDGSFIQHGNIAYTGSYGPAMIDDMSKLLYLLTGSTWAFTDPNVANAYDWAIDAFAPLIHDGAMMDAVRGRGIARQYSTDHTAGRSVVTALVRLAQAGATSWPQQSAAINAAVKGWMARDTTFGASYLSATPTAVAGVYSPLPVYEMTLMKALAADPDVPAAPEPAGVRVFASMDRVMQRGPGFAASLSLFSNRIAAFEYGNGENLAGWWTGMGMLALYDADQARYLDGYWPTVDKLRLPGTTTDRSGSGTPVAWKSYPNTRNWVGGAQLGDLYAAVGMDFATSGVTGSALTGRKSWFMFGDRIVAVGAGIASTGGAAVETIVENSKLNADGSNALTVNGVAQPATPGSGAALGAVRWAHLAGNVPGADVAWYFPDAPTVNSLRETRTATWRTMYSGASTASVSNHFHSLALPHGANPTAGTYAYVILPGRSAAQAAAYAAAPAVTILERSATATAVRDTALGLVGAHFWTDASKTVNVDGAPYVTSNRKAAVLTKEADNVLQVAVADPTQANTGTITVEIARAAGAAIATSPGVTVNQLKPTIRLTVDVRAAAGKSFHASFSVLRTKTLRPVADATLRDGSYGATNYGGTATVVVKNDGVGYARQALARFDLSSIDGTIGAATLKLAPRFVGQASAMTHNVLQVADAWSETGVTWNTRPADIATLGTWTVPAINSYATLDVTSAAAAALAGGKRLSVRVEAAAYYGANGWVEYSSRENGTAPLPALVVDYY
ncbi:polysaccharide lyase family 8 super-sandwich domain-containing protein [Pseudoduganella lutea]|uniref:DNRLRE domain-containing protein n=1 Tax=Pseudoduganella lutea TaxID=321985 RepID=A0A4V0Z307_9BURK|nr:polysaccharide lyase family 8 super-sandwich domain-containing protein [Pseudoduganella lutea]QBE61783.1 DNRLRE domain-containing protein [Pseudoduganella lutea]